MVTKNLLPVLFVAVFLSENANSVPIWGKRATLAPPVEQRNILKTQELIEAKELISPDFTIASFRGGDATFKSVQNLMSGFPLTDIFAYATLLSGIAVVIDPHFTFEKFGMTETLERDSLSEMFAKAIGYIQVGTGLTILLADKSPLTRAVGIGILPRIVLLTQFLVSGWWSKIGIKWAKEKIIMKLVIGSGVVGSLLSGNIYPETLVKVVAGLNMLGGVPLFLAPLATLRFFGAMDLEEEDNKQAKVMMEGAGAHLLGYGVYVGMLSIGCDPMQALASTSATYALCNAKMATTKSYEVLGVSLNAVISKFIVLSGFSAGLFLQNQKKNDE